MATTIPAAVVISASPIPLAASVAPTLPCPPPISRLFKGVDQAGDGAE